MIVPVVTGVLTLALLVVCIAVWARFRRRICCESTDVEGGPLDDSPGGAGREEEEEAPVACCGYLIHVGREKGTGLCHLTAAATAIWGLVHDGVPRQRIVLHASRPDDGKELEFVLSEEHGWVITVGELSHMCTWIDDVVTFDYELELLEKAGCERLTFMYFDQGDAGALSGVRAESSKVSYEEFRERMEKASQRFKLSLFMVLSCGSGAFLNWAFLVGGRWQSPVLAISATHGGDVEWRA
jgi:hypothetical protein